MADELSARETKSDLGVSLAALASRKALIEPALLACKRYIEDDDVKYIATNFILVQVSAFLEEWRIFRSFGEKHEDVRETTQIAKPALERIERWKGVREYRNSMIAHTRRKSTETPLLVGDVSNVPSNYAEQMLLGECAVYAIAVALNRHAEVRRQFFRNHPKGHNLNGGGIETKGEFVEAIRDIRSEICRLDPRLEQQFGEFNPWA